MIELKRTERIIAVVPQTASGQGWSNRVVWVHIVDSTNNGYRCECLQPEEQPRVLWEFFRIGEVVHYELMSAVQTVVRKSPTTRNPVGFSQGW